MDQNIWPSTVPEIPWESEKPRMLRALGTKLILRPVPAPEFTQSGLWVGTKTDPIYDDKYYVISAGPKVAIDGLKHGGVVLVGQGAGQAFDFEGHPLRVIDQTEILMVLP